MTSPSHRRGCRRPSCLTSEPASYPPPSPSSSAPDRPSTQPDTTAPVACSASPAARTPSSSNLAGKCEPSDLAGKCEPSDLAGKSEPPPPPRLSAAAARARSPAGSSDFLTVSGLSPFNCGVLRAPDCPHENAPRAFVPDCPPVLYIHKN